MENNNLDWKVNGALNSLDGMQRATSNPFLYTRIKAAIDEQSGVWARAAGIFGRPAYALSICAIFVSLNLWVAVNAQYEKSVAISTNDFEQAFAAEFATVNYNMSEFNSNDK